MEKWAVIPGFEGFYEVSDRGNVRSLYREVKYGRHGKTIYKGRELKQFTSKHGYFCVKLSTFKGTKTYYVHHLVLSAFVGERPVTKERGEIRHLDGNKRNNNLINICYGTISENAADRARHAGIK
jgi:NUMOD4 motif/HNH endonuclease